MADQTFTDITPINQKFTDVSPIGALRADTAKGSAPPSGVGAPPGYFSRLGQSMGIPTTSEGLKGAAKSTAEGLISPVIPAVESAMDYGKGVYQGAKRGIQEVKEASQNVREGGKLLPNIGKAASGMAEAYTSAVPLVGPSVWQAGEDWFKKNYRGALGGMTGTVLQLTGLTDEVRGRAGELGKASEKSGVGNINKALDVPGGKGGDKATAMLSDLNAAKGDLADIQRTTPLKGSGAERFHELAEKIDAKQNRIWDEAHKPQVQRWGSEPVKSEGLVEETRKALPPEVEDASIQETAQAAKWIQETLDRPRTLQQLDGLLRRVNNDIQAKKYETYGPTGIAARQAAARAIRTEIDRVLMEKGEPGVREFNRRWGALDNIKTRSQERAVQLARTDAKTGKVPDWVHPYLFLHPDWGTLTGVSANLSKLKRSPAGRLQSGLSELRRTGIGSPSNPPFRLVGPPGEMPQPEQPTLPGSLSPDVTQPNFRPQGRSDTSFPANIVEGIKVGGVNYVWDPNERMWVRK